MHGPGLERDVDEKDANRISCLVPPTTKIPPSSTHQPTNTSTTTATPPPLQRFGCPFLGSRWQCCAVSSHLVSTLLPPRPPSFSSSSSLASPVIRLHVCISLFTFVSPVANPPSFAVAPVMCCPFESFTQHALLRLPSPLTFFIYLTETTGSRRNLKAHSHQE